MECYSALKKETEISSREKTHEKCKCMLLSERSQSEKTAYCRVPTVRPSGNGTTTETVKTSVVAQGRGEGWIGEHRGFFGQ